MRKFRLSIVTILIIGITLSLFGCKNTINNGKNNEIGISETDNYIVKDGKSEYIIVLPNNPRNWETLAGNEMVDNVFKSTGVTLPLKKENEASEDEKMLVIGETELAQKAGVFAPIKEFGARGFVIKEKDGNVYMVGGDTQGTLYSVYEFLHYEFGYEPYAIDEIALEKGVKARKILAFDIKAIPDIPYVQGVHEYYRFNNAAEGHRMRFNTYNEIFIGSEQPWHNVFSYLPKEQYLKTHPKWYTNDGNELHYTAHGDKEELQIMQDTIFDKMVSMIEEDFAKGKYCEYIGFMQRDHSDGFPVDDSPYDTEDGHVDSVKALEQKYGKSYPAAMLIKFINPLQERISQYMQENHPGRKMSIMFFAYEQSESAPVKEVNGEFKPIDDSVVCHKDSSVFMAFIRANYIKDFDDSGIAAKVQAWNALASKQAFWFYNFYFNTSTFVYLDIVNSLQTYFQAAKKNNALYVFFESPMTKNCYFPFNNLNVYLYSKLGWDVNCNVRELIENYFKNYYKDASDLMLQYFDSVIAYCAVAKETTTISGVVGVGADLKQYWNCGVTESWIKIINKAFEAIEPIKYSDKALYNELYSRILYDSLMPRYLLLKHFAKESFTDAEFADEVMAFKADCAKLEVISAGNSIPDVQEIQFVR